MIDKEKGTMTVLKVTRPSGHVNYHPNNPINRKFHNEKRKNCSKEKKEKYLIEEVTLTLKEAAELGFDEALVVLNPPKAKQNLDTSEAILMLMKQNQELISALSANLSPKSAEEQETTPTKKGGKNG